MQKVPLFVLIVSFFSFSSFAINTGEIEDNSIQKFKQLSCSEKGKKALADFPSIEKVKSKIIDRLENIFTKGCESNPQEELLNSWCTNKKLLASSVENKDLSMYYLNKLYQVYHEALLIPPKLASSSKEIILENYKEIYTVSMAYLSIQKDFTYYSILPKNIDCNYSNHYYWEEQFHAFRRLWLEEANKQNEFLSAAIENYPHIASFLQSIEEVRGYGNYLEALHKVFYESYIKEERSISLGF